MARRGEKLLCCPQCHRHGVSLMMSRSDDGWSCRYCAWWAYTNGEDTLDRQNRKALAELNPDHDIWVTDSSSPIA